MYVYVYMHIYVYMYVYMYVVCVYVCGICIWLSRGTPSTQLIVSTLSELSCGHGEGVMISPVCVYVCMYMHMHMYEGPAAATAKA